MSHSLRRAGLDREEGGVEQARRLGLEQGQRVEAGRRREEEGLERIRLER